MKVGHHVVSCRSLLLHTTILNDIMNALVNVENFGPRVI